MVQRKNREAPIAKIREEHAKNHTGRARGDNEGVLGEEETNQIIT